MSKEVQFDTDLVESQEHMQNLISNLDYLLQLRPYQQRQALKQQTLQSHGINPHTTVQHLKHLRGLKEVIFQNTVKDSFEVGKITGKIQGRFDSKIKECEHF